MNTTPNKAVLLCHGFSATPFEWQEFWDYLVKHHYAGKIVAPALATDNLSQSTWESWGDPILKEYRKLESEGYTNISLVGASVSGALILHYLINNSFAKNPPKHVFLVDPFIIAENKWLYLLRYLPSFIQFSVDWGKERTDIEKEHWINTIPSNALHQLIHLRKILIKELPLLKNTANIQIFRSQKDPVVSEKTLQLLKKFSIRYFDSNQHVLTRGKGRAVWSNQDAKFQAEIFQEILKKIN